MVDEAEDPLEAAIASACGLIGGGADVRSVSVVGGRRLTAAELLRSQERALACAVRLTMDGSGTVTLRHQARTNDDGAQPFRSVRGLLFLPRVRLPRGGITGTGTSSADENGRIQDAGRHPPTGHLRPERS